MSPSEPVEDAIDPLKLCLGKLTGAMALRPLHLRGSGRVPNSTQNQSRYAGPHLERRVEDYGFARGEEAVRTTRG